MPETHVVPSETVTPAAQPFNYAALPTPQAELAQQVEVRIKARTAHCIVENGLDLITVKQALGHGQFETWLESWFPFAPRTAREWMSAAREYADKTALSGASAK